MKEFPNHVLEVDDKCDGITFCHVVSALEIEWTFINWGMFSVFTLTAVGIIS